MKGPSLKLDDCLTVIFKPTSCCNLCCKYCFSHSYRDKKRSMTNEEIIHAVNWVKDYVLFRNIKAVTWIWHGGEPMLMGVTKFEELTKYILDIFGENGIRLRLAMQTNLTLLSEKWIEVLSEYYNGILGVSLDYKTNARVDSLGNLYDDKVLSNINFLRTNNVEISGVITLVTPNNVKLAREMFAFYKENHLDFQTSRYFPSTNPLPGETQYAVSDEDYYMFLKELFDIWFEDEDPKISVVSLNEMAVGLLHGYRTLCIAQENGCTQRIICIEAGGEIYNCGRYDTNEFMLGTVFDKVSLISEKIEARKRYVLPLKCKSCRYFALCFGGCRYEYDTSRRNLNCNVDRKILSYIEKKLRKSNCELPTLKTAEEFSSEYISFK